ncbi:MULTISPECIES: hypothetical protein [Clostridium]|uniref:hypothetical protein n=1 Tax=Clostridium TaxID=1485 RepID=UPI000CC78C75|nr:MULTISPECIES: hypothetical protein [Clostridium]PJI10502.1 hypothetical protein CUB90_00475 [Clostridium sp. CT7]
MKDNRLIGTLITCTCTIFVLSICIRRFIVTRDPLTSFYIGVLLIIFTANIIYYKCDV